MGLLLLIVINLLYAATPVCMKIAAGELAPIQLVWLRHTLALLAILPFVWHGRFPALRRDALLRIGFATFLAFTCASLLQVVAMRQAPASAGAMVVALEPLAMMALAILFLGERFRGMIVGALIMALTGLAFLAGHEVARFEAGLLYFLAIVCEAALPVLLWPLLTTHPPRQIVFSCLLFASIYLLPFQFAVDPRAFMTMSGAAWGSILFLAGGCSVLALLLWIVSLQRFGVATVALSWFLQPVCGGLIAIVALGEPVTLNLVVGGAVIFAAVGCLSWSERSASAPAGRIESPPMPLSVVRRQLGLRTAPRYLGTPTAPLPWSVLKRRFLPAYRHHPSQRRYRRAA